jgi:hypothetical protein
MLDRNGGNDAIKAIIRNGNPFLINRMRSEMDVIFKMMKGIPLADANYNSLFVNCGVYPYADQEQIGNFTRETLASLYLTDAWGYCTYFVPYQDWFIHNASRSKCVFDFTALEPFYHEEPWTLELKGKKVLIIHPYVDTMKKQESKLLDIWKGKPLFENTEFKYLKAVQSIAGNGPHSSWSESYEHMKTQISEIDFDVALLGCGGYGMPMSGHIKSIGKSAVYVGGGLQLVFGIKGKRWDESDVSGFYNEHWVRPSQEEMPNNYTLVEGGCYW